MTNIDRRLARLSTTDVRFLKLLVRFGGACTRKQAAVAFGVKDGENVRKKLKFMCDEKLLIAQDLSDRIPAGHTVYLPTRTVASHFRCDRREPKDTEQVVSKCYRFFIAASHQSETIVNYLCGADSLPVTLEVFKKIANAHRDEAYSPTENKIYIDLLTTWTKAKSRNKILFWATMLPTAKLVIYSSSRDYSERVIEDLPADIALRIVKPLLQKYDTLCARFARHYGHEPAPQEHGE